METDDRLRARTETGPSGGCNGTPLGVTSARLDGFIASGGAQTAKCFHQDGAFYTRHTRRRNVCRPASLSVSHSPPSLIPARPHTHTPLSKPLPCLSPPFFPSINSVTPSSGPWHYRKTELKKEREGGCGGREGDGRRGWVRKMERGTLQKKGGRRIVKARGRDL